MSSILAGLSLAVFHLSPLTPLVAQGGPASRPHLESSAEARAPSPIIRIQSAPCPRLGATVVESAAGDGAQVADIQAGCPAARAGLQIDDVITAFDGRTVRDRFELMHALLLAQPGQREVAYLRNGVQATASVTVEGRAAQAEAAVQLVANARQQFQETEARSAKILQLADGADLRVLGVEFIDQTRWSDLDGEWNVRAISTGPGGDSAREQWNLTVAITSDRERFFGSGTMTTQLMTRPSVTTAPGRAPTKKQLAAVEEQMRARTGSVTVEGTMYNGKDVRMTLRANIEGRPINIVYEGEYYRSNFLRMKADGAPSMEFYRPRAPAPKLHEWASWSGQTRQQQSEIRQAAAQDEIERKYDAWLADCRARLSAARSQSDFKAFVEACQVIPAGGDKPLDIIMALGDVFEHGRNGERDLMAALSTYGNLVLFWGEIAPDETYVADADRKAAFKRVRALMYAEAPKIAAKARAALSTGDQQTATELFIDAGRYGDTSSLYEAARLLEKGPAIPRPVFKDHDKTERYNWAYDFYLAAGRRGHQPSVRWLIQQNENFFAESEDKYRTDMRICANRTYFTTTNGWGIIMNDGAAQRQACFDGAKYTHNNRTERYRKNGKYLEGLLK